MATINNILRFSYMKDRFEYRGTLRNERKFNLNDRVFFNSNIYGNAIFCGIVVGIEKSVDENPEYKYTIRIPEDVCRAAGFDGSPTFRGITCEAIFSSIEHARTSAKQRLESMYRLQNEEIDRYFNQWSTKK